MIKNIIKDELYKWKVNEDLIKIPNFPNTMNFFHGGNLDYIDDNISQKIGSRKLYLVSVEYEKNKKHH